MCESQYSYLRDATEVPSGLTKNSFPCSSFSTIQPSGTVVSNIKPSGTLSSASIMCHKLSSFVQGCDMTGLKFCQKRLSLFFWPFDTKSLKNEQLYGISHCKSVTDLKKKMWLYFCLHQDMTRCSYLYSKWKKRDFEILTNTIFS